ncbi:MAG: DUF2764 domain-containing protein [Tannerella sp.]|jgi:hypothetical protein|nr:DUF2764 domain-containing protein [Tannerella sp.]
MSKYYCLIAGLPSVTLDDVKLTCPVPAFKTELDTILSDQDKLLMRWLFFKYDNHNLLSFLRKRPGYKFDGRGEFSEEEIREICDLLKEEDKTPENISVPAYFAKFVRRYYARFEETESIEFQLLEDYISALYYSEAIECRNVFLSSWFEMNLNIGNILTAQNCQKYGLDKSSYIIGENEIARQLRQSSARDFNIGKTFDYVAEVVQIAEDQDLIMREKRLDVMRWKWLDDNTFFKTFDIESVIAYMLRLEMIERRILLDKIRGEKTFRKLVSDMKRESSNTLEEFKKNNR